MYLAKIAYYKKSNNKSVTITLYKKELVNSLVSFKQ